MRHLAVWTVVAVLALCGLLFAIFWKSNQNCEATLIFAQAMEQAVNNNPDQTVQERRKAKAFFDDVYSKLNC